MELIHNVHKPIKYKTMKINIFLLSLFLLCFSCKEFEDVDMPGDLPRLPEICAQYEKLLSDAGDGWITEYQPTENSGIVSIYMQFHDNGTMDIQSNYPGYTDLQKEIRYRVGGMVLPELTFETACIWTELYQALGGDYLFTMEIQSKDTLLLKMARAPFERPTCVVTRANAEKKESFDKNISTVKKLNEFINNAIAYFKNLELTGPQGKMEAFTEFNTGKSNVTLTYQDEFGNVVVSERKYKVDGDRIILVPAAFINNIEVQYLQLGEIKENGNMSIPDAGEGLSGELTTAHTPPFPYKGSAKFYTTYAGRLDYVDASKKMKELTDPILGISYNNNYLTTFINYPLNQNQNNFVIYTSAAEWLYYSIDISQKGEDVIYHNYISANVAGQKYMETIALYLYEMCDSKGYTVLWSANDKKILTLVNRSDSRYWIKMKYQ